MRYDRNRPAKGATAALDHVTEDLARAEERLAEARLSLMQADATVHRRRQRVAMLRQSQATVAEEIQRWWRLAATTGDCLPTVAQGDDARKRVAAVTAMMATACEREQRANARAERLRRDLARCWADHRDWNHLATATNRLLSIETQLHNRPPDDHVTYQNLTTSHVRAEAAKARVTGIQPMLSLARQDAGKTSAEVLRLSHIVQGLSTDGFSAYLARATPADRRTVLGLNDAAQQRGQQRAGRPAASSDDPRTAHKARRAKRARERRTRAKAERVQPSEAVSLSARTVEEATTVPASSTLTVPKMAPLHPQVRHHLRRMQAMTPDDRVVYQRFLDWSRDRGWAAVIVDAQERDRHPLRQYHAPHAAIPLGPSARLIAVRGDPRDGLAQDLAHGLRTDGQALERWLREPLDHRLALMGKRSRLRNGAIHVVAAWSPTLHDAAEVGDWDEAFAREVDLLIARFDLAGHRVAAFLHLDSESRHPHLHIVASRVRTGDGSLWSLAGRERAVALWLHGRSNTASTFGHDALTDDIDALAGRSPAAIAGEALLTYGKLTALRHHPDGRRVAIALQGPEAVGRVAAVGQTARDLAGGIWLFGLGVDARVQRSWKQALLSAQVAGDNETAKMVHSARPPQRGYWLDVNGNGITDSLERSSGFGRYLAR